MENKDQIEALLILAHRYIPKDKLAQFGIIEKPKKELFTTEDGVKKYEGDSWFYISNAGEVKETEDFVSTTPGFITKRFHDEKLALKASVQLHDSKVFSLNDINALLNNVPNSKGVKGEIRRIVYEDLYIK